MSTTPSGTDINTLREEGNERNCFVSLIVNNAGTYYAAVTRKLQTKSEVTIKNLGTSYEFFGDGTKEIKHDDTTTTKVVDKEVIEYYDLDVERHEVQNTLAYLDTRFEEIKARKTNNQAPSHINNLKSNDTSDRDFFNWLHGNAAKEQSLNFEDSSNSIISSIGDNNPYTFDVDWQPNKSKIHKAAISIVACSLILNAEKFDLKQWIIKHMSNVYARIFESSVYYEEGSEKFIEWRDFIIQYTIDHFDVDDAPEALFEEPDIMQSRIAQAIYNEIKEFEDLNPYMKDYCTSLCNYIIE